MVMMRIGNVSNDDEDNDGHIGDDDDDDVWSHQ